MAAGSTGKTTTRRKQGSKAATGTGKAAGAKKTAPSKKKPAPKKKKTAPRRKKPAKGSRSRGIWTGVVIGLLIGVIGAIVFIYRPKVTLFPDADPPVRAAKPTPPSSPAPTRKPEAPKAEAHAPYEENGDLERGIKRLDLLIYSTLGRMGVAEEAMGFTSVTPRAKGEHHWDQARIRVRLPEGLESATAVKGLQKAMINAGLKPAPNIEANRTKQGVTVVVRSDGMETHVIELWDAPSKTASVKEPKPPVQAAGQRPKVAFIIDDFGREMEQVKCFTQLRTLVGVSVLPFLAHSREVAEVAAKSGRPVMLHLPMEPTGWPDVNPGPGALMTSMDRTQVESAVNAALESVPGAGGANNHMGSRFTEDAGRMGWTLAALKAKGLYFVDSRTSSHSTAYATARKIGMRTGKRTIFLDNVPEPEAIRIQLKKLVSQARAHGRAVAIGHVYPVTCQVLDTEFGYLKSKVDVIPISSMVQ